MSTEREERLEIRDLLENWVVWRDAAMWERFRSVWHSDGRMMATWFQGTADEFISVSRSGFDQTKMTISQRAPVDGVECDVVCTGRFYDFIEKREGKWGIVLRQPIYEKDRIDPVDPQLAPKLDRAVLERFPIGYRHLAYLQTGIGYEVKKDMPGLVGEAVEKLYARGQSWLIGGAAD
jgi:hypothetical protein